jgi:Integrase core domain
LRYSLSLRDVEELLEERGLQADYTTVWRWVQRYGPELEQHIRRHLKPTNKSWRVDETYVRVQETWGYLHPCRNVLHYRDTKFCASFRSAQASGGVKTLPLPAKSPNLNAFAERWVRSVKQECLSKLILFGKGPLSRVLSEYSRHYHQERNHQGKGNRLLFPHASEKPNRQRRSIECRHRLGGLLKDYTRAA